MITRLLAASAIFSAHCGYEPLTITHHDLAVEGTFVYIQRAAGFLANPNNHTPHQVNAARIVVSGFLLKNRTYESVLKAIINDPQASPAQRQEAKYKLHSTGFLKMSPEELAQAISFNAKLRDPNDRPSDLGQL